MQLKEGEIERYLAARHAAPVDIREIRPLGSPESGSDALKQFGYGRPLLIIYRVNGQEKQEVLHRVRAMRLAGSGRMIGQRPSGWITKRSTRCRAT
jgi:hypothetical protein